MKNRVLLISIIIGLFLISSCRFFVLEDLAEVNLISKNDFDYYPQKDIYKVGDTLWLEFSFSKNINYIYGEKEGTVILKKNNYNVSISFLLGKINNFNDSISYESINFKSDELIPKIGTLDDYANFIFDDESDKYINVFGIVLKESGKFFFSNFYNKSSEFRFKIYNVLEDTDIEKIDEHLSAQFFSTFQTTNKGWFEFEVVE
jgi:hypothetical protein